MTLQLTDCQQQALELLYTKKNIFLTGFAGSGKSFLIREFIKNLDHKAFPVLASTGAAAVLIGGRTFHSFFGLGILEGGLDETIGRACEDRRVQSRLKKIEGFILDEVSMISGQAFTAAEHICRKVRKNKLPWGGVRVISVGDFAQLPPINRYRQEKDWAFQTEAWDQSEFHPIVLKTMVRTDDRTFMQVLNDVREGHVTPMVREFLNQKVEPFIEDYEGTSLYPRRLSAEKYNEKCLNQIDGELHIFSSEYFGQKKYIEVLKKSSPISDQLLLKESAYVMTRTNDPQYRFINGSTGHVIEIRPDSLLIQLKNKRIVEIEKATFSLLNADGELVASVCNFPISLAYATTIHKSQGMTLSELMVDLKGLWEPGQAYVALSRLECGSGLHISGWDENSIQTDSCVQEFHKNIYKF